jgi:hypothetical protein
MVASSTLIPPSVDAKPSSSTTTTLLPRKDSNASSSGAFSEVSRSFGHEENSTDSLFGLTPSSSSHYVIKCNLNTTTPTSTPSAATPTSLPTPPPPVTLTPRVKLTVQQPSITNRKSSRFDSATDPVPSSSSSSFLKTPISSNLPLYSSSLMSNSIASSAPEFSISGASSIDESEELALYEHYLSISHGRQSNPSPEMRKKTIDDWDKMQQRPLPRSRSEANTVPIDHSQQQQQQQTATSQIKTVSKFFLIYDILSDHCC